MLLTCSNKFKIIIIFIYLKTKKGVLLHFELQCGPQTEVSKSSKCSSWLNFQTQALTSCSLLPFLAVYNIHIFLYKNAFSTSALRGFLFHYCVVLKNTDFLFSSLRKAEKEEDEMRLRR